MVLGIGGALALMLIPYTVESTHSLDGRMSCGLPLLEVVRYYLVPTDCFHEAVVRVALGALTVFVLVALGVLAAHLRGGPRNGPSSLPPG